MRHLAEKALQAVNQQIQDVPAAGRDHCSERRGGRADPLAKLPKRRRPAANDRGGRHRQPAIIQPGYVPEGKVGNPLQTIVLGLLLGVVLGLGLALLREQADRRLHRADQVSAAFDAPVLTTVPRDRTLKRYVPFRELPFETAEAFRMLQMNLRFGRQEAGPQRAHHVVAQRRGQDHDLVEPRLRRGVGGLSVALVEADLRRT